jgi:hypothetical protein
MNQHNDKTPYTYSIYFYRKGSKKHSRKTVIQSDVEGDFVVQPFARKALRRPGDSKAVCFRSDTGKSAVELFAEYFPYNLSGG